MKIKSLALSLVVLLLSAFALAQYPVGPNTGLQTTPFSNNYFSATFNNTVDVTPGTRNTANTSTNYVYESSNHGVIQDVVIHLVDHDIPVDYTSSDYYANDDRTGGTVLTTSQASWDGHPFTYTCRKFTGANGVEYTRRTRFIIVNARVAIFISQTSLNSYDDQKEWLDFEYSLRIK